MNFFKKYQGQMIGVAIAAIVIVLGMVLLRSKPAVGEQASQNSLKVVEAPASAFETIQVGQHTYNLAGVDFMFRPVGQKTTVQIQIKDMTKDGHPVTVLPFGLGTYDGTCSVMEKPQGFIPLMATHPLAFAQCKTLNMSREFVVYEQGSSVVTDTRTLTQDTVSPFEKIQTIDLGALIQ